MSRRRAAAGQEAPGGDESAPEVPGCEAAADTDNGEPAAGDDEDGGDGSAPEVQAGGRRKARNDDDCRGEGPSPVGDRALRASKRRRT